MRERGERREGGEAREGREAGGKREERRRHSMPGKEVHVICNNGESELMYCVLRQWSAYQ